MGYHFSSGFHVCAGLGGNKPVATAEAVIKTRSTSVAVYFKLLIE